MGRISTPHRVLGALVGAALFVVSALFLSTNSLAQTTTGSTSLLARFAAGRTSKLMASFTYGPTFPIVGESVRFMDTSTGGPRFWKWDFGDGVTSTYQNPSHVYRTAGLKKITLVATTATGSKTSSRTVAVVPESGASFVFSPSTPGPGQTVQFADTSSGNPTSWLWDFGDGASSTAKNPSYAYRTAASYTVRLTVSDASGSRRASRTLTVASISVLSSSFSYSPTSPQTGQAIQFTDMSAGSPSFWAWDFGDGVTSTAQNPSHSYATAGSKAVRLIATNSTGSSTATRTIQVASSLMAAFTYTPASPSLGQAVQFTDGSTGNPTSWSWDFGDGSTSTLRHPTHVFGVAGSFRVSLTAADGSRSNTVSQTLGVGGSIDASFAYAPVSPAPGQAVQFTDTSAGDVTSWGWDFNDGSTSSDRHPSHVFSNPGRYYVALVASGANGSDSITQTIVVGSEDGSVRTYWVSSTGAATWAGARSETPLSGSACCSLSTANANAAAGDRVYLRQGTYSTGIKPSNSGASGQVITFMAYPGETPTIRVTNERAITLVGKSYIKVDGLRSYESQAFFFIGYGACYNEITNCVFDKSSGQYSVGLISFYSTAFAEGAPSNHNWLHHNVFSRYGGVTGGDDLGTIRIAGFKTDPSAHNTFEDNVFFYGGHDNLDIGGQYNVVRNNVFHNEEAYYADTTRSSENRPVSGYFGNRNIILSNYGNGPGTANHTLIEGNRIGYAGAPPDDDGSCGIENAGVHTITRQNDIYGNGGMGYYSKMQGDYPEVSTAMLSGSWARVYNNNFFANGFGDPSIDTQFKHGICIWSYRTYNNWPQDVVIKNNIVYNNYNEWRVGSDNILPQVTYENNYSQNPVFFDTDMSDKTSQALPDLRLQPGSPCIDAGIHLTQARGGGSGSTTLAVLDALSFQDGSWGSALTHGVTHFADRIAIGTVTDVVEIASIDYATRTITLKTPMTWTDGAKIWLFSNSNGLRVLNGAAPDMGAHEFDQP